MRLFFVGVGSILLWSAFRDVDTVKVVSVEKRIVHDTIPFSAVELKEFISDLGLRCQDIVYAQAVMESGGFDSKIFKSNNNLFGMRLAKSRPTTAKGERNGFAYYDSWQMSVIDYAYFQSAYMRKLKTREAYLKYLGENYASSSSYVEHIKKHLE